METETEVKPSVFVGFKKTAETTARILGELDLVLPVSTHAYIYDNRITILPQSDEESRKLMGLLIRYQGHKPKVAKQYEGDLSLSATWNVGDGVTLRLAGYKPRTCKVVTKQIEHPAEPEKIVPAKEAYVETVSELVCDLGDGDVTVGESK